MESVKQEDGTIPRNAMYGDGHHTHRIPKTKWAAPVVAGHDCPFDEFLPRYPQHVRANLLDQLPELFGKILVVDSIPKALGIALAPLVDASQVFSVYLRLAAVRKLFPEHWLSGLALPFIEDLVNAPPFDLYTVRWLREVGADWSGPCGQALAPQAVRVLQRADGRRSQAASASSACPPPCDGG